MLIKSSSKNYFVSISTSFGDFLDIEIDDSTFVVVDSVVYELYKTLFSKIPMNKMYVFVATEDNKVIDQALNICEKLTALNSKRNTHLISIGGGITQDVTGFVANVLYRGIKWTFYPTTLLAACDSCIGGKTSLNYKKYKNLLGTFYPPNNIVICTPFFKTLSQKDYLSGLGEIVKFGIMRGNDGLARIEKCIFDLLTRDDKELLKVVKDSLSFKKVFIEDDEFDKGSRIKLNFAHTFGHAFETVTNYAIPHGTAVAMGVIVANKISLNRKWISNDFAVRAENVLKQIIFIDKSLLNIPFSNLLSAIKKDKKQVDDNLTAVLYSEEKNDLKIVHDLSISEVQDAISYMLSIL